MKKARQVSIPDDRALTREECAELLAHAKKSALWYATTYNKNSYQIRAKLIDKGYPEGAVEVHTDEGSRWVDFIEETLDELIESSILDDDRYIDEVYTYSRTAGKSIGAIRTKLIRSGLPKEIVNAKLNDLVDENEDDDEEQDLLNRAAHKVMSTSRFERADPQKKKQMLLRTLASKGFQVGDIFSWLEKNPLS